MSFSIHRKFKSDNKQQKYQTDSAEHCDKLILHIVIMTDNIDKYKTFRYDVTQLRHFEWLKKQLHERLQRAHERLEAWKNRCVQLERQRDDLLHKVMPGYEMHSTLANFLFIYNSAKTKTLIPSQCTNFTPKNKIRGMNNSFWQVN